MTAMHNFPTSGDRKMIRTAMRAEMLEREDELALAKAWRDKGDESALNRLTNAYLRLVISMAGKFKHYGIPLGDLIQEGSVGLLEAASRFEPERDVRFSTYAGWWVRAAMQDFVLRNWSIVRTGTTSAHKSLFFNLKRLKTQLGVPNDKPLPLEGRQKIAKDMGVREVDVTLMEGRLSGVDRSLNAPVADESVQEWQDLLPSEDPAPDEAVADAVDQDKRTRLIADAMENLSEREALIIRERRLVEEGVTLSELGKRLGVSKERVRQLEAQALGKLKKALVSAIGDPVAAGLFAA